MNRPPVYSKKSRSLLLLLTKTFNLVHLEALARHKQEIGIKLPQNAAMKLTTLNYQFHESARLRPQDRFFANFSLS